MEGKSRQRRAIVIGAGVGGVATAAYLAKAGFDVTVCEKNDFTGGRCSLIHHDGYRFDRGPSLLLLPRIFYETFEDLRTCLNKKDVEFLKCEPNYNVWFSDGDCFRLSTDLSQMKEQIERYEGKDGYSRFLAFLREAHAHYEISVREVLKKNFPSIFSMARPSFLKHLLALHPFESIYSRASKYFWTERLRRAFTFGSMYMGMSPFEAPGTYSLLQYTELAEGIWYPKGGFHAVIERLVRDGEELGVKYRLCAPIRRILLSLDKKTAQGVELESGEALHADVVVNNSDLVYAYNELLEPSSTAKSLKARQASCSSISFYWAMNRQFLELEAHNIFLADDYRESFDDIFKKQLIPKEPSFYVNVPSRIDPSAAPPDTDSVVVLVPVGHLLDEAEGKGLDAHKTQDWDEMVDSARETVYRTIQNRTGADLRDAMIAEYVNTPVTWKDKFNLDKGAILGLSHSFFNVLSFRPKTKHSSIDRLYFVGASTHPGTGVPICLAGSKLVAEQILDSFGMKKPWAKSGGKNHHVKEIDKVHLFPLLSNVQLALLACLMVLIGLIYYGKG